MKYYRFISRSIDKIDNIHPNLETIERHNNSNLLFLQSSEKNNTFVKIIAKSLIKVGSFDEGAIACI